jgi:hypothetical protein
MTLVARLDDIGKPAWIGLTVVGFMIWWPFGLVMLGFLIGSGRMGCWTGRRGWQRQMDRMQSAASSWCGPRGGWGGGQSSGNRAFDEYRQETLRRLEEEQREFREFLERLRHAKDKAEFDEFMAERGRNPQTPPPAPQR